jgi:hypothetical protein
MYSAEQIRFFLSFFTPYIPTLLVSILAIVVIVTKWKQAPGAAMWALFGFGLVLLFCLISPLGYFFLQRWAMEGGASLSRTWAFTIYGFVNAVLHAGVYLLLLVAVFTGRK